MPLFVPDAQTLVLNANDYGVGATGIQNAINKLPATGGTVFMPYGTYTLSAPLTVPATITSGFRLVGAGWGTVLTLANGVNDYAIKCLEGASGLQGGMFDHFKIDGNCANQTNGGGIDAYGATWCSFHRLWLHACYHDGIHIHGGTLTGNFGIQSYVTNCLFDAGSGSTGNGRGLSLDSTDQIAIIGNTFQEMGGTSGSDAFCIRDTNGSSAIVGNTFSNNNGAHQGGGGIKTYGSYLRIIGNQFDSIAATNVALFGFGHVVSGNNFLNVGKGAGVANSAAGVYANTNRHNIIGNYFSSDGSGTNGTEAFVFLDDNTTASTVSGNIFDTNNGGSGFSNIRLGAGTSNKIGYNTGWTTEKSGTANITTGNTSVVVTHGLSATPTLQQISVTPQTSLGSAAFFWVSSPTSTNFTINVNANPAGTVTFGWQANIAL